jgi:hypothetical protein
LRDTVSAFEGNPATEHTAVGLELAKRDQGFTEKVVATHQVPILDLEMESAKTHDTGINKRVLGYCTAKNKGEERRREKKGVEERGDAN